MRSLNLRALVYWFFLTCLGCGGGQTTPAAPSDQPGGEPTAATAKSPEPEPALAAPPGTNSVAEKSPEPVEPVEPELATLPSGTRVVHLGDSFAGALGVALGHELKALGIKSFLRYEKSTYIPTWAWSKELPDFHWKYRPDLFLITLGGNELKIPDPNQRAKTVRRLVSQLKGKPCVWIGIPLWEGANPALLEVIRQNVAPCLYLDSSALVPDLERARDGIHPNTAARKVWARAVIRWLQEHQQPGESNWVWRQP